MIRKPGLSPSDPSAPPHSPPLTRGHFTLSFPIAVEGRMAGGRGGGEEDEGIRQSTYKPNISAKTSTRHVENDEENTEAACTNETHIKPRAPDRARTKVI